VGYLLLTLSAAGYSWALLRHPKKQWAIRSYTSVLFAMAAIFATIAVKAPAFFNKVADQINFECADPSRELNLIDTIVYPAG
jgi:hypothetical protein